MEYGAKLFKSKKARKSCAFHHKKDPILSSSTVNAWGNFSLVQLFYQCVDVQKDFSNCSVANPGCLSRIPDPDFYPSRIPDPKTATNERGKKNYLSYLFCSHKFSQIGKILFLKC